MQWRSAKAALVFKTLLACGWHIKRQRGSHRVLGKNGYPNFVFAFHDREEIGPKMLARMSKHTGLAPEDL